MSTPKVLFVIDSLQVGGTGVSLVALLRRLSAECPDLSVDVVCLEGLGPLVHEVPAGVRVVEMPRRWPFHRGRRVAEPFITGSFLSSLVIRYQRLRNGGAETASAIMGPSQRYSIRRTRLFRRYPGAYTAAVSWTELGALYALVTKVEAAQKISWIHPDYRAAGFVADVDRPFVERVDRIVAVSATGRRTLGEAFPDLAPRAMWVSNVVDGDRIRSLAAAGTGGDASFFGKGLTFVTVCRLHDQSKALLRAIEISGRLVRSGRTFRWVIVGDGPDRSRLDQAITEAGLEDTVVLLGARTNPYPYMAQADAFVLQSYYEGMPMVVEEALALGVPVVATDYPSAHEQVREGVDGWVVENDASAVEACLLRLVDDPGMLAVVRETLSRSPRPLVSDDYSAFVEMLREVTATPAG